MTIPYMKILDNQSDRFKIQREVFGPPIFHSNPEEVKLSVFAHYAGWSEITTQDSETVKVFRHDFGETITVCYSNLEDGYQGFVILTPAPRIGGASPKVVEFTVRKDRTPSEVIYQSIRDAWLMMGYPMPW